MKKKYGILTNISSTSLQLVIHLFIFTVLMWIMVSGIWKLTLTFLEKSLLSHNVASFSVLLYVVCQEFLDLLFMKDIGL